MSFKLSPPIEETFHLERTDETFDVQGEPTIITIRQATQLQNERRFNQFATIKQRFIPGDDEVEISQRFSPPELMRVEAFLTLTGSNITSDDGKPLFNFKSDKNGRTVLDMSEKAFELAWGELPNLVAVEIHEKVLEVNPTWRRSSGEA